MHEIAHRIAPDTRVAYVDYDTVVCAHGRALLGGDNVKMIQGDIREIDALLTSPGLRKLIDFDQPVAFLMLAVLHFVSDEDGAYDIVRTLRAVSAPGSHLVISHAIDARPDTTPEALEIYKQATAALSLRTSEEIGRFFEGYELLEPGLVFPGTGGPTPSRPPHPNDIGRSATPASPAVPDPVHGAQSPSAGGGADISAPPSRRGARVLRRLSARQFCAPSSLASSARIASMSRARTCLIRSSRAGAGSAPGWAKTTMPSRIAMTVGIEVISNPWARACSTSVSIFPNVMSSCFSDAFSKIGPNVRHGPHQAAQKSSRTIPLSAISLKFASVTSMVATAAPLSSPSSVRLA
nr:hypothetical protein GCM10020093_004140 [Planobispora longispora]